jgi:hypothetical protein
LKAIKAILYIFDKRQNTDYEEITNLSLLPDNFLLWAIGTTNTNSEILFIRRFEK